MYVPSPFKEENPEVLQKFMAKFSFATLYSTGEQGALASHIPLFFEDDGSPWGALMGHVARANPQWKHFDKAVEAMAVFQGPHSYISPSWYQEKLAVPTWNYMAVHAYGIPNIVEEKDGVFHILKKTVAIYEAGFEKPWDIPLPKDYLDNLMKGIVAFRLPLNRLEGKFKLSQNRSDGDRNGVIAELEKGDSTQVELANAMKFRARES